MFKKSLVCFCFYLCLWQTLFSQQATPLYLKLNGYLGKEQIDSAVKDIDAKPASNPLILELSTLSADADQVFALSKRLLLAKEKSGAKVIVYIQDNAIGPGAILPFLADEIYTSTFVSWGDIPSGAEQQTPKNLLKNRVLSLLPPSHPKARVLADLASAMIDASYRPQEGSDLAKLGLFSAANTEPLILNQNDLNALKLVQRSLPLAQFQQLFELNQASPVQTDSTVQTLNSSLLQRLQSSIKYRQEGPNLIGYITIDDRQSGINQATWLYVKQALESYKEKKPIFVILELNTPGGEVFAAQKISDALKELDTQYNIPVIAFINNWAISAGAMLAYSCRFISVVKDASMGAAEPVIAQQGGEMKAASEKVNSALRTDFANRASFFDRNPNIAEAMVDKDIILVQRHGRVIKLDSESQIRTTGNDPDVLISPKGKLLTLNSDQLMKYGVADILLLPTKHELITEAEREKGQWPANKTLLFQSPFFKEIPNATVDVYQMDWRTRFLSLLSHPVVSSLLFLGMMIGFYVEINTPGFGLPGSVALICLFLIVLSSFALEIGNMLELIFLVVGILILLVEIFVLPTFGLLGIAGVVLFLVGLFGLMLPGLDSIDYEFDTGSFNAAGEAFFERLAILCLTLFIGVIVMALLSRYVLPKFLSWNRFVLVGNEQDASAGYISGENPASLPKVGERGEAITPLRTSGKIAINDQLYDAISSGGFIEQGEKVVVLRIEGSVIVVRLANQDEEA